MLVIANLVATTVRFLLLRAWIRPNRPVLDLDLEDLALSGREAKLWFDT